MVGLTQTSGRPWAARRSASTSASCLELTYGMPSWPAVKTCVSSAVPPGGQRGQGRADEAGGAGDQGLGHRASLRVRLAPPGASRCRARTPAGRSRSARRSEGLEPGGGDAIAAAGAAALVRDLYYGI